MKRGAYEFIDNIIVVGVWVCLFVLSFQGDQYYALDNALGLLLEAKTAEAFASILVPIIGIYLMFAFWGAWTRLGGSARLLGGKKPR